MIEPNCSNCKHWRGGVTCDAYPSGIPWPIQSGDVSHIGSLPEDNGIVYEPIEQLNEKSPQDTTERKDAH